MAARNGHQLLQSLIERRLVPLIGDFPQIHAGFVKDLPRQPARAAFLVLPDILQNIRHLQALAERHGQPHHRLAMFFDLARVIAEKLGQHFSHHAGHVIAVAIELRHILQTVYVLVCLKHRHAFGHDADRATQDRALGRGKPVRQPGDSRYVLDQIALGRNSAFRQQRVQLRAKAFGARSAVDHVDEELGKVAFLCRRYRRLILDGIGDAAQQVGIADNLAQCRGQLRYG